MATFKIIIETEDDTTLEEIENIIGETLNDKGVLCTYDVEEKKD